MENMKNMDFKPSAELTKRIITTYSGASEKHYSGYWVGKIRSRIGDSLAGAIISFAQKTANEKGHEVLLGNAGRGFYDDIAEGLMYFLQLPKGANKLLWPLYCELEDYLVKPMAPCDGRYGVLGFERGIMAFKHLNKKNLLWTPPLRRKKG